MIKKLLLLFFITISAAEIVSAQNLAGFWNGKISRKSGKRYGADNFEIHIYQSGKDIWGYTFAYTDTSRFVLYKFSGKLDKKEKMVAMQEFGYAYVLLPEEFNPCEKKFELKYTKINNTKYLTGKWSGIYIDTTCYADEELLVAVQKVNIPFFANDMTEIEKISHFFADSKKYSRAEQDKPEIEIAATVAQDTEKIKLWDRKLDIQQIVTVNDTVIYISLYDNAENDGDTVSVFINKKPFIIRQRISNKPIKFTIPFTNKGEAIELLFQAENLGEIPPNTGIMVVENNGKRYEIRVQSDFEKHAVIIFTPNGLNSALKQIPIVIKSTANMQLTNEKFTVAELQAAKPTKNKTPALNKNPLATSYCAGPVIKSITATKISSTAAARQINPSPIKKSFALL